MLVYSLLMMSIPFASVELGVHLNSLHCRQTSCGLHIGNLFVISTKTTRNIESTFRKLLNHSFHLEAKHFIIPSCCSLFSSTGARGGSFDFLCRWQWWFFRGIHISISLSLWMDFRRGFIIRLLRCLSDLKLWHHNERSQTHEMTVDETYIRRRQSGNVAYRLFMSWRRLGCH